MTQITGNNNANRISTTFAVNAGDNFALPVPTNNLQVLALGGADTIDTGAGLVSNSTFQGGSGNDSIAIGSGGAVSSTFFGGEGNDIITVAGALTSSAIQSLTGNNRVTTATANLAFIRTDVGSDTINLGQGGYLTQFSTVRAGDGADSINIIGGVNNSTIFAGNGNDTINITGALANTLVQTLTGNNTIGGLETLNASSIQTGSGADTIFLTGALTNSVVRAGAANDSITLLGAMTNSSIFAGEGNDTISLLGNAVRTGSSFTSVTGDNRFVISQASAEGTINDNNFTGGSGDDRIVFFQTTNATNFFIANNFSAISTAEVSGGVLTTGAAISARGVTNIMLTGAAGTGVIATGALSPLTILGNGNANAITGGLGADTINAGGGANTISGAGIGADQIIHNTANSSAAIAVGGSNTVTLNASQNGATTTSASTSFVNASSSISSVGLTGSGGVDTLIGGSGNDTITGAAGADVLIGTGGNNQFRYLVGAELFANDALVDSIVGGTGSDSIVLAANVGLTITNTVAFTRAQSVETIAASIANTNIISLTLGATAFTAGIRAVNLSGDTDKTANNVVNVATAVAGQNITITGSAGIDQITGGAGNDIITGGAGADVMAGGAGNNVFAYTANGQSGTTADATAMDSATFDSITDFKVGATDLIGFTAAMGVNSFESARITFAEQTFAANSVSVVTLATIPVPGAADAAGATAAEGNAALLVFNNTGAAITTGAANNLSTTGLGTAAGLQVIGLAGQTGINYGGITAADFNFSFA